MTIEKWRAKTEFVGIVDGDVQTVSFDDVLTGMWDYFGRMRAEAGIEFDTLSRKDLETVRAQWINNYLMDRHPKVEGYIDATGQLELGRLYTVLNNLVNGYDVLQSFADDEDVTEIQVNEYNSIYYEKKGKCRQAFDPITKKPLQFRSPEACRVFINTLLQSANTELSESQQKCLGNSITPEGWRVAAVGSFAMAADKGKSYSAVKSPACVIRKFSKNVISTKDLVNWYSMSDQMAEFISLLGDNHASVVVAGETGSGKTVNLQSVIDSIHDGTRAISLEKDSELRLRHRDPVTGITTNNVLQFEYVIPGKTNANLFSSTSNTAENIFVQILRLTPRTIIFGEVRGEDEIGMLLTAAEAGHNVMCTIHAGSPLETIERIVNAISKSSPGQQKSDIMNTVCSAIDIIIVPTQMNDGTRKVIEIAEVCGCEIKNGIAKPIINTLYKFKQNGFVDDKVYGEHIQLNTITPGLLEKWSRKGMKPEVTQFLTTPVRDTKNGDPGTYNGKRSPFKDIPRYTPTPETEAVDWEAMMSINPKIKSHSEIGDLIRGFDYDDSEEEDSDS